jgi:hypothetical protein
MIEWNVPPAAIGAAMDVSAEELPFLMGGALSFTLDGAQQAGKRAILTRGQRNGVITGSRIDTGAMFNAMGAEMHGATAAGVSGEYGFTDGPPYWTIFQEFGTSRGIIPVGALVEASEYVRRNLPVRVSQVDVWRNLG